MDVDKDRALAFARDAMTWMAQKNIAPTPENYELIYAYVGGENPDLKHTIDGLVANGCKFDNNVTGILHQRYFRARRDDDQMAELGEKISSELDSMLKLVETAGRDQAAYGTTLSRASGQLNNSNLPNGAIQSLISQVLTATRAMEARSKTLEDKLQNSSHEVTQLRERLESVRRESLTDQLTGIPNRRAFDAQLKDSIEHAIETGEELSLFLCDIDHFKKFNDTWGHQTGDQVLRLVANCLSENVKGRDTAARYGGEEFVAILPRTSLKDAIKLANQIRTVVESKTLMKKSTGDKLGTITISIGVARYDLNDTADEFVRRADACLYAAKHQGRNRVVSERDELPIKGAPAAA
jgi:diguanylate cyclase